MTTKTRPSGGDDGVRRYPNAARRRMVPLVALAVGLPIVATLVAVLVIRLGAEERSPAATTPVRASAAPRAAAPLPRAASTFASPEAVARTPGIAVVRRRVPPDAGTAAHPAQPAAAGRAAARGPAPTPDANRPEIDAVDAITALRAEGETEGIAAFGLPGTDPPKPGIIVPDDFALPEGFVRHYQTTDDGQQLPPILMVHPDYELLDAAGNRVSTPDGVVPPELAPPGMRVEMLQPPERRTRTNLPE